MTRTRRAHAGRPDGPARGRPVLFCVPYAGGSASCYRSWSPGLAEVSDVVALELPGRGSRASEPALQDLGRLVERLAAQVEPEVRRPFALFGHSMGALVGFELARLLRRRHGVEPEHVFVSAFGAPQDHRPHSRLHALPEPALIERLRRWGGIPEAVLDRAFVRRMLPRMVPTLRADLEIVETYAYVHDDPFRCPITAFVGSEDPLWCVDQVEPWRAQTRGPFRLERVPGGHFFVEAERLRILRAIAQELQPTPEAA